jgi:hypothetical protein
MRNGKRLIGMVLGITMGAGSLAAQGFEGVVAFKIWSKGKPMDMTMSIKGGLTRTDMSAEGHNGVMLMNPQSKTMTMIMADEKMYMTMSMPSGEHQEATPKITDLGTRATVAGRECKNYLIEDGKRTTEVCNGEGLGDFMMGRGPMGQGPGADIGDILTSRSHFQNGFFPLRVTRIKGEQRTVQMEVTGVDAKTLDAALFQVPAGYTEMKMPGMGPPGN